MQRPDGFDKSPKPDARPAGRVAREARVSRPAPEKPRKAPKPPRDTSAREARRDARRDASAARGDARRAAAERRRYERAEVKRFTRRQRTRRIAVAVTVSVVGLVVALVLVAIFSPILSLRTVVVDGTSRVDASAVSSAIEEQLGTPLALIDYGKIDAALREFPVIRSYTTETIPPGTIAVHIVEREPVVSVALPAGGYVFVDAAGVTVQQSNDRLPGVPLVTERRHDAAESGVLRGGRGAPRDARGPPLAGRHDHREDPRRRAAHARRRHAGGEVGGARTTRRRRRSSSRRSAGNSAARRGRSTSRRSRTGSSGRPDSRHAARVPGRGARPAPTFGAEILYRGELYSSSRS